MLEAFLCILWIFVSLFLVLIILLQRGKGGGLAGALGGVGGSSAFGTKAGDIFTRITVGVFAVWLILAMMLVWKMKPPARFVGAAGPAAKEAKGAATGGRKIADDDKGASVDEKGKGANDKDKDAKELGGAAKNASTGTPVAPSVPSDASKDGKSKDESKKNDPKAVLPKEEPKTPTVKDDKTSPDKSKTPPVKNETGKKS